MKQTCRARRRRTSPGALPNVEADVMMIAAGRDKGRFLSPKLMKFEPEHAAIESERPLQVGNFEMDMTNADTRIDRFGFVRHVFSKTSKSQAPTSSEVPNSKYRSNVGSFGAWWLVFPWSLDVGFWSFWQFPRTGAPQQKNARRDWRGCQNGIFIPRFLTRNDH
jgi:hypothetical protein